MVTTYILVDELSTVILTMTEKTKFDPANGIIARFGIGQAELARRLDLDRSTICHWTREKSRKGTGGSIPIAHWPKLLKLAKSEGIKLTLEELAGL